jgi:hypothetical protein
VSSLSNLTYLNLSNTGVDDQSVSFLRHLAGLTYLNLDARGITDAALPGLQVPSLHLLLLSLVCGSVSIRVDTTA